MVFDGRGEPQALHAFRRELPRRRARRGRRRAARARAADRGARLRAGAPGARRPRALALPVAAGRDDGRCRRRGWSPSRTAAACRSSTALVLHQAVTVVALELLRRRVAASTERRLAGDVLVGARSRRRSRDRSSTRRLEPFGLGGRVTALVLAPPARTPGTGGGPEACEAALVSALRDEAVSGLVATASDLVCALLPGFLDEELFELAERVLRPRGRQAGQCPGGGRGPRSRRRATRGGPTTRRAARWRRTLVGRSAPSRTERHGHGPTAPRRPSRRSRPTATSGPSSCCCPCRTPTRCACSASPCSARSRPARATTAAS